METTGVLNLLRRVWRWVATDGLLHFLVCYAMMLTFGPFLGNWIALGIALAFAFGKEAKDVFIEKDNNFSQAMHDLICDFAGIVAALLVM
jgi:hypothetical protein